MYLCINVYLSQMYVEGLGGCALPSVRSPITGNRLHIVRGGEQVRPSCVSARCALRARERERERSEMLRNADLAVLELSLYCASSHSRIEYWLWHSFINCPN